jgi:hypothetical protein
MGGVGSTRERYIRTTFLPENLKGEDCLKDLGVDGWITYVDVGWIHLAQDNPITDSCEHNSEPSSSIKGRKFLI